jgi:hypothetical protein
MTAPVYLSTSLSNELLTLQWPLSGAGMTLKSTTNLTVWTNTTNAIQDTNSIFSTIVPVNNSNSRFFRLQSN